MMPSNPAWTQPHVVGRPNAARRPGWGAVLVWALVVAAPLHAQTASPSAPPAAGDPDAVVEIVEFSDFECPFCARAWPVLKAVLERHRGVIRLVFRHYPLPMHPHADRASEAAVEAERQGAFWPYHDLLFAHQDRLSDVDLLGYADSLGLDTSAFEHALVDGVHAARVQSDIELGASLAVTGTPTFFVNGYRLVGVPPLWVFDEAVRAFSAGRVRKRALAPVRPGAGTGAAD